MEVNITNSMLEKLTHNLQEIRIRNLRDIESKIKRGLVLGNNLIVNPINLLKALIRWFGQLPICESDTVLELISLLLQSKYGQEVVDHLSRSRIVKELEKIRYLIGSDEYYREIVENVIETVNNFQVNEVTGAESLGNTMSSMKISCIDLTQSADVEEECSFRNIANYYTKCWEEPGMFDLRSIKNLNSSLSSDCGHENLNHDLKYLQSAIKDYPAEYFLQPPYIFKTLSSLLKRKSEGSKTIIDSFINLTKSLQGRVCNRQMATMYSYDEEKNEDSHKIVQISISRYCYELLLLAIDHLKSISDEIEQEETNAVFNLMLEIVVLCKHDPISEDDLEDILKELGFLTKYYRQSWEFDSSSYKFRTQYLISIYILSVLIKYHEKEQEIGLQNTLFPNKMSYNPSDFESMNTEHVNNSNKNWMHELQIALVDYPLKNVYPEVYGLVVSCCAAGENDKINCLLNAKEVLIDAIEILRQPDKLSNEELIFKGLGAINTLYFHKSRGMITLLVKAISNCSSYFEGNERLKEAGEQLLLRLLASSDDEVKSIVYSLCTEKVKYFFSCLDEGSILSNRKPYSNVPTKCYALGIPFNIEILTEILCFGYGHSNKEIHNNAETLLLIILKSKGFLGNRWNDILEILTPILPLLTAIADKNTNLGKSIISLFHPNFDLPQLEMIRGNLRMMYANDAEIRDEALTRLLFIMKIQPQSNLYAPTIANIQDTIPNTICLLPNKYDIKKLTTSNMYEKSCVEPLVAALANDSSDPGSRRTALVQLNVMAEDPSLCEVIHRLNGWAFIINTLDNALREKHVLDYPDSAVPAIGILTKLCIAISEFRRFLSENAVIYNLIVRALFLFHHLPVFKADCSSLIFLLMYSDYTLGNTFSLSLPHIVFRLNVPFVSEFHWKFSPFNKMSYLEEIFVEKIDSCCSEYEPGSNAKIVWQYLRLCFASLWFDAFENILVNSRRCKQMGKPIDYTVLPPHLVGGQEEGIIDLCDSILDFDKKLKLCKGDLDMIKKTVLNGKFRHDLKEIQGATSHHQVFIGISGLESSLILPLNEQIQHDLIVKSLRRFVLTVPNNREDETVFKSVVKLLKNLIEIGYENILVWVVDQLFAEESVFIKLLKSETCSEEVFEKNIEFIKAVVKESLSSPDPNLIALFLNTGEYGQVKKEFNYNLLNVFFEIIVKRLDENLQKCNLPKMRWLMSLLRVVVTTNKIEFDENYINHVINKLLSYISAIKSMTQTASNITKNGLISACSLMDRVKEINVKSKHFQFLSSYCGHTNDLVRSTCWNILAKISKQLQGAHKVIKYLSLLPGGIHACCLSTILDPKEISLVKESICSLFVNLMSHKINDHELHKSVAPMCSERDSDAKDSPVSLIFNIMKRQKIYDRLLETLHNFSPLNLIELGFEGKITTCDEVRSYCMIFISLIDLKPEIVDVLIEKSGIQMLLECVSKVSMLPSKASLEMVSGVCLFLIRCLRSKKDEICNIIIQNQHVAGGLIYLLNVELYQNFEEKVMIETTQNIMNVISVVVSCNSGVQMFNLVMAEMDFEPIVVMLMNGISNRDNKDYQITSLRFLSLILIRTPLEFPSCILPLFEAVEIKNIPLDKNNPDLVKSANLQRTISLEKIKTEILDNNDDKTSPLLNRRNVKSNVKNYQLASELIAVNLFHQFELICAKDRLKNGVLESSLLKRMLFKTMQINLKQLKGVRNVAKDTRLLQKIIDRFETIHAGLGINCTDYIRRFGDTKKVPIIEELSLLTGLLSCWFSKETLLSEASIAEICKIILKFWAWGNCNRALQIEFMKLLANLSEKSIPVCKAIAAIHSGYSHSILKLIAAVLPVETSKVKNPKDDLTLLTILLRILTNCCSCYEGRNLISKLNILDIVDNLHPNATLKNQKQWAMVLQLWLSFWEVFTRYPEFAIIRRLPLLCTVIRSGTPELRILSLKIIRNMSFVNNNRPALLSSQDYLYIIKSVLSGNNRKDQCIVLITMWKLIANYHKGKSLIKNSPIVRKLNALLQEVSLEEKRDDDDLFNVLTIITKILQ